MKDFETLFLEATHQPDDKTVSSDIKSLKQSLETIAEDVKIKAKQPLEPKEFITKRKKGAADIQKKAEAKGGAALLTAVHFAAKEKPYEYALKVCEKENAATLIKDKASDVMKELKDWSNLTQQRFQHLMGMLEAYGEVYLQLK